MNEFTRPPRSRHLYLPRSHRPLPPCHPSPQPIWAYVRHGQTDSARLAGIRDVAAAGGGPPPLAAAGVKGAILAVEGLSMLAMLFGIQGLLFGTGLMGPIFLVPYVAVLPRTHASHTTRLELSQLAHSSQALFRTANASLSQHSHPLARSTHLPNVLPFLPCPPLLSFPSLPFPRSLPILSDTLVARSH